MKMIGVLVDVLRAFDCVLMDSINRVKLVSLILAFLGAVLGENSAVYNQQDLSQRRESR